LFAGGLFEDELLLLFALIFATVLLGFAGGWAKIELSIKQAKIAKNSVFILRNYKY